MADNKESVGVKAEKTEDVVSDQKSSIEKLENNLENLDLKNEKNEKAKDEKIESEDTAVVEEEMTDKTIKCVKCFNEFVFSNGEQKFYKEKGFSHDPVRCPDCRRFQKAQRNTNKNRGRGRGRGGYAQRGGWWNNRASYGNFGNEQASMSPEQMANHHRMLAAQEFAMAQAYQLQAQRQMMGGSQMDNSLMGGHYEDYQSPQQAAYFQQQQFNPYGDSSMMQPPYQQNPFG